MNDAAPLEIFECRECRRPSPPCDDSLTIFARRHGWSLARRLEGDKLVLEWYCPECFKKRMRR